MVGKTRLIRTTGSPLIGGLTERRRPVVVRTVVALVSLAVIAVAVWYFFIR